MRRPCVLGAALVACSFLAVPSASASVSIGVSVNFFHDALAPYGDWVQTGQFGLVWTPRHVAYGWRPYTRGHWVLTDADWTWVSDENWGWATEHYGRWAYDAGYGWIWVPGDEWAPAWVAWRSGGDYVGWAPLPPQVDVFRAGFNLEIDPLAFAFVETRYLCEPRVYNRFVPAARNVTIVNITRNVTNYTVVNGRVVDRGVEVRNIERATGHAVPRVELRDSVSIDAARGARAAHGQLSVYRPSVSATPAAPSRNVRAFDRPMQRPEQLQRQQDQERRQFESARDRERTQLSKIQEHEIKKAPAPADDRGRAHSEPVTAERAPSAVVRPAAPVRTSSSPEPRASARQADPRPQTVDRRQLSDLHEQEKQAQAQHETRERSALAQRQERERQAVQQNPPDKSSKHDR